SDFLTVFKEFRALVKTQHSAIIKCFRYDLGGEYTSNYFVSLLKSDGTIYQTSCTDTPQQNGVARSFLLFADVPSIFWSEAVLTTTYVINRIPTTHNYGLSPFEKLYRTSPDYSSLRHIPYHFIPASSHNLTQFELIKIDPFEEPTPIVSPITPEPALETASKTTTTTETPPIIISEATPIVTQPPPTITQSSFKVAAVPPANVQPTHIRKSTRKDDFVAMAEELAALHQTQTWDLVPLPVGKRYAQEYGMDYEETFSRVAKITRIRTLITVPSSRKVRNLRKTLYSLKQAPRAWYEKFTIVVTSLGFVSSDHDSTLFVKQSSAGCTLLLLYVDDMIITRDDCVRIKSLKLELAHSFATKDLSLLCYFLGIEVASSPKGYLLSQLKYIGILGIQFLVK
ncbi:integrase, partial [Tanacetum coccineum]